MEEVRILKSDYDSAMKLLKEISQIDDISNQDIKDWTAWLNWWRATRKTMAKEAYAKLELKRENNG